MTAIPPTYRTIDRCRVCKGSTLTDLFSLGDHYVNDFPPTREACYTGAKCPIRLVQCSSCSLVQLRDTAPQELLYTRKYWYRSGVTQTMRHALRDVTRQVESTVWLSPEDVVLDLGSNDSSLLRSYSRPCIRIGVEPAENLQEEAQGEGLTILDSFWGTDSGLESYWKASNGKPAKVVTACGMFYDLDDPNRFIADVARVLDREGVFLCQLMCANQMLRVGDVGNICHEHLEFYTLQSLDYLFNSNGLEIVDISENAVNGGSYRLVVTHHNNSLRRMGKQSVSLARNLEQSMKLDQPEPYKAFFERMRENRDACVSYIRREKELGRKTWILGASTKGNTIAQFYGLTDSLIEGASERSQEKWGRYMVGSGIPIYSEQHAREVNPHYFLIMPFAFKEEIMAREKSWHREGRKFLIPLPEFGVV